MAIDSAAGSNTSGPRDRRVVLTVGHSNQSIESFLDLLRVHHVDLIVDVRKMPASRRNPQFSQDALRETLAQAGIGYIHSPGLGGLRRRMPGSPNTGWRNESFQAFADYMLTEEFRNSLDELLAQALGHRAALMCAEAVPWRCHRSLIADALVIRDVAVEHILSNRRTDRHAIRPWARVEGHEITYPPSSGEAP